MSHPLPDSCTMHLPVEEGGFQKFQETLGPMRVTALRPHKTDVCNLVADPVLILDDFSVCLRKRGSLSFKLGTHDATSVSNYTLMVRPASR
jgi:hypothetical protein